MDDRTLEHVFLPTNGIRLHVVQSGSRYGPLAILLHGFPEFWYGWRKQIQPLSNAGLRVWAPDQRGYNQSDKPRGISAYKIDELARDVVGLIDAAGVEKCYLAGHDWGAAVAWWVAINYPDRIDKLAILNVPHPVVMSQALSRNLNQLKKSWYMFFFQIPLLPEAILRNNDWELMVRMLQNSAQPKAFSDKDINQYIQAWWRNDAITSMLNWYRAILQKPPSLYGDLRVRVPSLILWGAQDVALSREMAKPSLELCDQGKLVFFENSSHWVQHDESELVNKYLLEFFSIAQ
jgi:pimeloyl-ACP methyl ester carboxylesterase